MRSGSTVHPSYPMDDTGDVAVRAPELRITVHSALRFRPTGMHFELWSTGGPPSSPTWLLIDGKDSNLSIRGLCAKLHALPTIIVPVGSTNAKGGLARKHLNLPYYSSIQGASFVTQLLTLAPAQPGLPFGITNGQQAKMPTNPGTYGHAAVYLQSWTPKSSSLSMLVSYGGAPVAQLK